VVFAYDANLTAAVVAEGLEVAAPAPPA